jgi:hypothetical protein
VLSFIEMIRESFNIVGFEIAKLRAAIDSGRDGPIDLLE